MSAASLSLVEAVERQNAVLERLESTLDREEGIPGRATTRRSRGSAGDTATGPEEGRRATNVDASVDDRPTQASVDEAPRRRLGERRAVTGAADFRSALRRVSMKRQPRPRRRG